VNTTYLITFDQLEKQMKRIPHLICAVVYIGFLTLLTGTSLNAAMNPYVKIAIVTGGSALACGVTADVLSDEGDKSDNALKAALVCGGIAAAVSAGDTATAHNGIQENKYVQAATHINRDPPLFNLLLSAQGTTLSVTLPF
jgi:hypothetical protein